MRQADGANRWPKLETGCKIEQRYETETSTLAGWAERTAIGLRPGRLQMRDMEGPWCESIYRQVRGTVSCLAKVKSGRSFAESQ